MKTLGRFRILFLLWIVFIACRALQPKPTEPTPTSDAGDFTNWKAWGIAWQSVEIHESVTVKWEEDQKTYVPEQKDHIFLMMRSEILNISSDVQEMRFPKGPIYVTDPEGNVYDLVGIAKQENFLMAPPYLIRDTTYFTMGKWDDGSFISAAYQPDPGIWFIQASPGALFHIDFLFAVPGDIRGMVMTFGNGMTVTVK